MKPDISIVVPSRGRNSKLLNLLNYLSRQEVGNGERFEVIVALDGSEGNGSKQLDGSYPFELHVIPLERVGISATKNAAVAKSTGRFIIFANDDIQPEPDFVHQHALAQVEGNPVVLGNSPFIECENPNLFDVLVENSRIIFFYCHLQPGEKYNFRYAWNLNLSVSRELLEKVTGPFAEKLRPVFYDDIEFAYRLLGEEERVVYRPEAKAMHDHRYTFDGYFEREALLGLMACQLWSVNRDCFKAIFSAEYEDLVRKAETGLDLDIADGQRNLSWLAETCDKPWSYDCDRQFLQAVYTAHLPLKRRAFRVGLKAADDANRIPWQERIPLARKALMEDFVFYTCHYWSETP